MKLDEKLNYFRKLEAIANEKFKGKIKDDKDIRNAIMSLNVARGQLKTAGVWGPTKASDGMTVDKFKKEAYEESLKRINVLYDHISQEEIENFKFPDVSKKLEEMNERANNVKTMKEFSDFYKEYLAFVKGPISVETEKNMNEIYYKMNRNFAEYTVEEEKKSKEEKNENVAPIKKSKFAQIYDSMKGKTKSAWNKIQSIFKRKEIDKQDLKKEEKDTMEK